METKDIVEQILNEAQTGRVVIGDEKGGYFQFNSRFYAEIEGVTNAKSNKYPIFKIYNFNSFIDSLDEYLKNARIFYKDDKEFFNLSDYSFNKKLVFDLFINATIFDAVDFERYVLIRTDMIDDDITSTTTTVGGIQGLEVIYETVKTRSNADAPFRFDIKIVDENGEEYYLPSVYYARTNNLTYIYSIKNIRKKQNKRMPKHVMDFFRSMNMGLPKIGVIHGIPNNVFSSLTILLLNEQKNGRFEIMIPCAVPLKRYVKYHTNKMIGFRHLDDRWNKINEESNHPFNKLNKTSRFMKLLLRFNYHFPSSALYYDEVSKQIKISLPNNLENEKDQNVIQELYRLIKAKEQAELEMGVYD